MPKSFLYYARKVGFMSRHFLNPFETFKIFDGDADSTFLAAIKL
jgi:hypothetical protein